MVGGGLLGSAVMLLAMLPRSTRRLERYDSEQPAATVVTAAVVVGAP